MRTTLRMLAAAGAAIGASGCASRPAAPSPAPLPAPTPAPTASPAATAATASRFVLFPGSAAYDVRSEATIEMTAGPAAERGRESVTTTGRVAYELTTAGRGASVTGQVDGIAVQASSRVGGEAPPSAPVRFRGTIDARGARLSADGPATSCLTAAGSAQATALAMAREPAVWAPAAIAVGTRWRDSTSAPTCRGPVSATATIAARYEVTAIDGARVRVRRETTVSLRGGGIVGGRNVTLTGSGAGSATLELDATRGRLTRSDGETRTTITLTLPDGARTFTQQTRTTVSGR